MNEKHLNPAATPAEALATEHARTIWWARHLTVHTRDPRLCGKKAPALHCGACQEVYAELNPSNIASTMGTAAAEHIKTAHPDFWTELIAHATRCLDAARICWDRRNILRPDLRPTLHENELFKNRTNIHIPCPIDCGVTLQDALTADQIKDEATLQLSDEAVEHCVTRLAEHLMRHRRSQIAQLL
jgi:hypothetical protein|nr:MAG TPA: hypothetical protein [Caudoviricetes sp.]